MGGANVASGRGVSGIPYNPSSIGFIQKSEAYFSQVNYLAGIKHGVFTYGTRIGPSDYVGFHLFLFRQWSYECNDRIISGWDW